MSHSISSVIDTMMMRSDKNVYICGAGGGGGVTINPIVQYCESYNGDCSVIGYHEKRPLKVLFAIEGVLITILLMKP